MEQFTYYRCVSSGKGCRLYSRVFLKFPKPSELKVADLGCGAGRYTKWLAERGFITYACDFSQGMINKTKEKLQVFNYPHLEERIKQSNLKQLYFEDEIFDIVLTNGVIHNAYTMEEYVQCIKECLRVLKKDGTIHMSIFTSDTIDVKLKKLEEHVYMTVDGLRMILFSKDEITRMMNEFGYRITDVCTLYDIKVETGVRSLFRATYRRIGS